MLLDQNTRNPSMPMTGLLKDTARSCASESYTQSVMAKVTAKVMKLSQGQFPTANAARFIASDKINSAGICTKLVLATYEKILYMPALSSYTTENVSRLVPMSVVMAMHAGSARTHHR